MDNRTNLPNGAPLDASVRIRRASATYKYVALLILIGLLCLLPLAINDYVQFIVNSILVYCLVAVGLNVVIGYLGQLAFASAAFFGIGAYATGLSMVYIGLPFPAAAVLGAIAGGLAGAAVGVPALHVRGYYLAIFTLAFGEVSDWVYINASGVTFGSGGFSLPDITIFHRYVGDRGKFYLFLVVVIIGIGATSLLLRSRFGRAFVAVRNNELAAQSLGINVKRTIIIAFAWSGLITGLAGALFAALDGHVTPDQFGISQMLVQFSMVVIGGLGSLVGSVIGAALLTGLPALLSGFPGLAEIVFSLLLILVLFLMPKGIGGFLGGHFPWLRERLYRDSRDA